MTCSGGDGIPAPSEIEINWQYANAVENPVPSLPADTIDPEQLLPQPRTNLNVDAEGYVLCSETMQCIGDFLISGNDFQWLLCFLILNFTSST